MRTHSSTLPLPERPIQKCETRGPIAVLNSLWSTGTHRSDAIGRPQCAVYALILLINASERTD